MFIFEGMGKFVRHLYFKFGFKVQFCFALLENTLYLSHFYLKSICSFGYNQSLL